MILFFKLVPIHLRWLYNHFEIRTIIPDQHNLEYWTKVFFMPPVYQPTPDISSNLRRHQKKINFWLSYAIKQCPIWRTVEELSIPNMHKTIEFQSLLFTISHLSPIGDLGPIAKKKKIFIKKIFIILKVLGHWSHLGSWSQVSLHSVYQT